MFKKSSKTEFGTEDEANNMQLDKEDTQRIQSNGKYLKVTVVLSEISRFVYLLILCSIGLCKVQLDLALRSPSKRS